MFQIVKYEIPTSTANLQQFQVSFEQQDYLTDYSYAVITGTSVAGTQIYKAFQNIIKKIQIQHDNSERMNIPDLPRFYLSDMQQDLENQKLIQYQTNTATISYQNIIGKQYMQVQQLQNNIKQYTLKLNQLFPCFQEKIIQVQKSLLLQGQIQNGNLFSDDNAEAGFADVKITLYLAQVIDPQNISQTLYQKLPKIVINQYLGQENINYVIPLQKYKLYSISHNITHNANILDKHDEVLPNEVSSYTCSKAYIQINDNILINAQNNYDVQGQYQSLSNQMYSKSLNFNIKIQSTPQDLKLYSTISSVRALQQFICYYFD